MKERRLALVLPLNRDPISMTNTTLCVHGVLQRSKCTYCSILSLPSHDQLATQEMGMATTNSAKLLVTRPAKEYSVFGSSQVPGSSFLNAIQTAHTNNSSATNPQGSAGVSMSADTNYWGLESMEPQHVHRREI